MHFPPFSIDPHRHVLMREGADVALSPHLVDILLHLATRHGEIVTKDSLLEQFWPEVNVTENTLTRAIADIRKALGDDSGSPRFIQTVARRGYRFVAPLGSPSEPAAGTSTRGSRGGSGTRGGADPIDPFRAWVKGRLSLEALDAAKLPDAVQAFEHAVAATPDYAPAHAGLANASFLQFERTRAENTPNRGPLTRAIDHARRACELDPSLGEAWASLGLVLTAAGEIEEARAAARRAAALEPTNWRHQFRLGIATWGEERLRAVDRTLALLPGFAPARFLSAMVFIARHAFSPAMDAAREGSTAQARQSVGSTTPFPAVGLHWLHGLLLMRDGHVGSAITEFAREIDAAQSDRIYSREFRVNAQVAAGFAHLGVRDAVGATEAFRAALETLPRNGRALIGLHQALLQTPLAPNASLLLPQIARSINELIAGGRPSEAALVTAALQVARGDLNAAGATIQQLVESAPPGQTGWIIPIDPALAPLRSARGFERIAALLAARAA